MTKKTNWTPEGYRTITPYMSIRNASQAIEFYKKAFGAEEMSKMLLPNGKVMHAELKIGDSFLMLGEESPELGSPSPQTLNGTTQGVFLYVRDVDTAFKQAVLAGAKAKMAPTDMFWGDRYCKLEDPYGHSWAMGTHQEDVAPEEMKKRAEKFMKEMK